MPTYEYVCTACGERTEAVQKFTDDPLTECPNCGGTLRKLFSSVGIVFKGSGFYRTDSRDGAKVSASSSSSESSSASSDSSSSSGDSSGVDPVNRRRGRCVGVRLSTRSQAARRRPPPPRRRAPARQRRSPQRAAQAEVGWQQAGREQLTAASPHAAPLVMHR